MVIKMNVPKLRFYEFNDEWKKEKLNKHASFLQGLTYNPKDISEEGVIVLRSSNIQNSSISYNDIIKVNINIPEKLKIHENDILMCVRNGSKKLVGKTALLGKSEEKCTWGAFMNIIRPVENNKFIYYYLNSPYFYKHIWKDLGTATVNQITKQTLDSFKLNIPTVTEQKKIGNMLSLLDRKIELQSKKIEALKLYKKGLINLVKNDWKNFKNYKINDIFKITRGVVIPKNKLSEEKNEIYKYPVYSSQTSNNGILGYDKIYDYDGKYLTWTTDGANAGKVFYRDGKFRCTNVCGILYEDNPLFTNEFVCELLNYETPKHVSYVGNPKLMNNVMENIDLKLPNNDILIKTSKLISLFNKKLENETTKLMKLHNLKKGLIQNMFV